MATKSLRKEKRIELTQYTPKAEKRLNILRISLVLAGKYSMGEKDTHVVLPLNQVSQWDSKTERMSNTICYKKW